jgi:hypothetical protein
MPQIEAPFDESQVAWLNQAQTHTGKGMPIHPFTCASRSDGQHGEEGGDLGVLIATTQGWVCPHCDYRQDWAQSAMFIAPRPAEVAGPLAAFFGRPSAHALTARIAAYTRLLREGRVGADVMLASLLLRQKELAGEEE